MVRETVYIFLTLTQMLLIQSRYRITRSTSSSFSSTTTIKPAYCVSLSRLCLGVIQKGTPLILRFKSLLKLSISSFACCIPSLSLNAIKGTLQITILLHNSSFYTFCQSISASHFCLFCSRYSALNSAIIETIRLLFFDFKIAVTAFVLREALILFLISIRLIQVFRLFYAITRRLASLSVLFRPVQALDSFCSYQEALESGLIDSVFFAASTQVDRVEAWAEVQVEGGVAIRDAYFLIAWVAFSALRVTVLRQLI